MRSFTITLLVAALLATIAPPAAANHARGPCTGYRARAADIEHPATRRIVAAERTIDLTWCLWRALDADRVVRWSTLLDLGQRESGFIPWAFNRTGCNGYGCGGVFQHHLAYWPGRARNLPRRWYPHQWPGIGWGNPRANVHAALRMIKAQGGICPAWC